VGLEFSCIFAAALRGSDGVGETVSEPRCSKGSKQISSLKFFLNFILDCKGNWFYLCIRFERHVKCSFKVEKSSLKNILKLSNKGCKFASAFTGLASRVAEKK